MCTTPQRSRRSTITAPGSSCIRAGISVIPVDHTTKRPASRLLPKDENGKPTWKPYQQVIADEATIRRWFGPGGAKAMAIVCGKVSGGLMVLDFDVSGFYEAWVSVAGEAAEGLPVQRTGGGGRQVFLRCPSPGGNDKLAWAPDGQEQTGRTIAIETRGEGGYAVIAPSLHPSGRQYEWLTGSLEHVPTINQDTADELLMKARKLCRAPHTRQESERIEARARDENQRRTARSGCANVIDAYNAAHTVEAVLERSGYTRGSGGRHIRPGGKSESVSVKDGRSCHWSTNDPLNDGRGNGGCGCHDAFSIYCHFEHGGSIRAAVKAAAELLGIQPAAEMPVHDIPYLATSQGILWQKPTREGEVLIPLTNFTATIVADVSRDDGTERETAFEIEATLGKRKARFTIPAARFNSMGWPAEHLGAEALVYPGITVKDHARAAIQMLSRRPIPRRTIYTHTGWRLIDGTWAYLHAGGAIGAAGPVQGVQVELPTALAPYELPDLPNGDELAVAIRASIKMLGLAPDTIIFPVFCAIWRAALGSCDFSPYLAGPSGVFKSELAALCQQHFGAGLDARHLPGSWHSTDNALEGLLFAAKDTIAVIDDFAPCGGPHDVARWHQRADRVLRAQGNNSGRGRMRPDGSLRPNKPPRGLAVSTGEEIPRGQSLRARMFITEISQGDINKSLLTRCQQDARAGVYAHTMAGFVRYLAPRYEQVRQGLRGEVEALRREAAEGSSHCRTPDIVANLALGLRYFIDFAQDAGVLSGTEGKALWSQGFEALIEAAARQADHQSASEPTRRFIELLTSAVASGHAHLADRDGNPPANAGAWGWRSRTRGTGAYAGEEWQPQGDRIGWLDGQDVLLDPDASYRAAQNMAGGDGLVITARTLRKRLAEKGSLVRPGDRQELTHRRLLEGRQRNVVLLAEGVFSTESTRSTISTTDPAFGTENGDEWGVPMVDDPAARGAIHHRIPPFTPAGASKNGTDGGNGGLGGKRTGDTPAEMQEVRV
jgi:hypothetical protein